MKAALYATKVSPEEGWERMVRNGIINREGKVTRLVGARRARTGRDASCQPKGARGQRQSLICAPGDYVALAANWHRLAGGDGIFLPSPSAVLSGGRGAGGEGMRVFLGILNLFSFVFRALVRTNHYSFIPSTIPQFTSVVNDCKEFANVLALSPCQSTLCVNDLCLRRRARIGLPTAFRCRKPSPDKGFGVAARSGTIEPKKSSIKSILDWRGGPWFADGKTAPDSSRSVNQIG